MTSRPSNQTLPALAASNPAINLNKVLLPDPDGPSTTSNSPGLMLKSIGSQRGDTTRKNLRKLSELDLGQWLSSKGKDTIEQGTASPGFQIPDAQNTAVVLVVSCLMQPRGFLCPFQSKERLGTCNSPALLRIRAILPKNS